MFALKKVRWVIAAVLAVSALGTGGYFVRKDLIAAQACSVLRAQPGPILTARAGKEKVVVLGDSYSSGDTLPTRTDAWPYRLPNIVDWGVSVNAVGGTGFTNPGPCGDSAFIARAGMVVATKPAMLIVQGGLNDYQADPTVLRKAVTLFLSRVKDVPRVVLVGPVSAPSRREGAEIVDAVLAQVAAEHHIEYVSTLRWGDPFSAAGLHLTAVGQRAYAAQLAAAINR